VSSSARPLVVAIDGPSGSGKSTVARELARWFGLGYLDTGAMYRALTWSCLEHGVDLADQEAVAQVLTDLPLRIGTDPVAPGVVLSGQDISAEIRLTRVSSQVSAVATNLAVRGQMRSMQRDLIGQHPNGVVVEGRDITTVVAPDATVRVLLTASEQARLERRARQLHGRTDSTALAATRDQVVRRDRDDSTVSQFTVAVDGVVTVDTSQMQVAEVVDALVALVSQTTGRSPATGAVRRAPEPALEQAP
jgi:CMP/dCMP kinase